MYIYLFIYAAVITVTFAVAFLFGWLTQIIIEFLVLSQFIAGYLGVTRR